MFIRFEYGTRFRLDDVEYEVRKIIDNNFEVMNLSYKEIELLDEQFVLSAYEKGRLFFKEDEGEKRNQEVQDSNDGLEHDLSQYTEEQIEEMNRRYKVIEPFIMGKIKGREVINYLKNYPIEQRPASMPELSSASFYRLVAIWNKYEDKRRLLPKDRGPKFRRIDSESAKRISKIVHAADNKAAKLNDRQLYKEYTNQIKKDNEERDEKNKLPKVSESTFRRIRKEIKDTYPRNKILYGTAKANLIKNGVSSETVTSRPLEIVEIDWTPIDLLIRDFDLDETKRPTLLHAVDKHTGYPLGFHIILKPEPNAQDLKQLLLYCTLPKTYLKELYPMVCFDWTAYGKPENIRLDNAKINDSRDFEELCSFLNIGLQYCEVRSGFQKGTVEGDFRNMDMKIFHANEGTLLPVGERDQYDPKEKACISMRGLYKIIHIWMVELRANNYNRGRRGVPAHLWEQGLKECKVQRKLPYKRQYLELLLATQGVQRKITPKGIELLGNFFFSDELNQLRLRLEREKGDTTVLVRYGDADLRTIFVRDQKEKRYIEAYPRPGSLENKKIDRLYPVHAEVLAYKCNKNNSDYYHFDEQVEENAYESIREIYISEKKDYRAAKRKRAREEAIDIPFVSAISGVPSHLVPGVEKMDLIKNIEDATHENQQSKPVSRRVSTIEVGKIDEPQPGNGIPYDVDLDSLPEWGSGTKGR
ncbi:Mu transposase C-terminal domain-containing protein [Cohnella lupini]|uniref:Putative transposase n=1 Tax=Cohnella lupini TaxID=1294267 RepID=A0A3D9HTV0_9BACL|nr:Mu transposase C-terminal domain-containing protein [Cohnella lupini]RED52897.1 putative transposase [Cohnella lupini]